jgi:hypothetical protein
METKKIKLSRPATIAGASVSELTMREPKVKDMRRARKGAPDDADQEIALFANLCEIAPSDIDELSLVDYKKIQEAFQGFTGSAES